MLEDALKGHASIDLAGHFAAALATPRAPPAAITTPAGHPETREAVADPLSRPAPDLSRRKLAPNRATPLRARPQTAAVASALVRDETPALPPAVAPVPVVALPVVATTTALDRAVPAQDEPPLTAPPLVSLPAAAPAAGEGPYARGLALEAKGDLQAAARELARAADLDARRGDLALYALGRLAQHQLHDSSRALSAFRRYRAQYPGGVLLPEVDIAILEIEVGGHQPEAALTDSTRFLVAHPTSERTEEVHLLRGNLLRDGGRFREALTDYAAIQAGALADEAVYSTAYCQRKLGDLASATTTLHEYLERFPTGPHRLEAEEAIESGAAHDKTF